MQYTIRLNLPKQPIIDEVALVYRPIAFEII